MRQAIFLVSISLVIVVFVVLGILLYQGCVSSELAQYVVLGLTLIVVLVYAYFTYRSFEVHRAEFQWSQNPVLVSVLRQDLNRYIRRDGKVDFQTFLYVENLGITHAVAKININPKIDGRSASSNDAYNGKRWWYVPGRKKIMGWFAFLEILESVNINLEDFEQKQFSFRLEIKIVYKKWEQKQEKPMLENPSDVYYYDHNKKIWIPEITTSEIQFPLFSNH